MTGDADILTWSLVLVGILVAAFLVVAFVRRRYFRTEHFPSHGFSIAELRKLRESGQISEAEFEKARTALLAQQDKKVR